MATDISGGGLSAPSGATNAGAGPSTGQGGSGTAFIGLLAVSSLFGAYGAYQQARMTEIQAHFNSVMSKIDAERELNAASYRENRAREAGESIKGTAVANASGQGFALSSGTNERAIGDIARAVELDAIAIRAGGQAAADKLRAEAAGYGLAGQAARSAGALNAAASITGGVMSYLKYKTGRE